MWGRLCLVVVLGCAALAPAPAAADQVGPADGITPNGRQLDPVGRMTKLGPFPTGGALTPNGRYYWAVDAGRGNNSVRIVDTKSGKIRQRLPIPGGYVGVAFGPGGQRAYVSGEPAEGDQPPDAKGVDGDVIHVYDVKRRSGRAKELEPLQIPGGTADGAAASDELPPASGVHAWPEGLAVTPDARYIVAALGQADQAAIIDLKTGKGTLADVGRYPYGVAIDPQRPRAYVTNERDGTVSVISVPGGETLGTIPVGQSRLDYSHPEGLVADPRRDRLYVAVTDRDRVAVIDTDSMSLERSVFVGVPGLPIGSAPVNVGLNPRGDTLYVANAGEDALLGLALSKRKRTKRACEGRRARKGHKCLPKGAIAGLAPYDVIGRMPTASYPSDVEVSRDGRRLVWLASKGLGTGPNPDGDSIKELLRGRTGVTPAPTDKRLRRLSKRAERVLVPTNYQEPPAGTPVIGPDGGASHEIKHVFYVVKENRTYDQIFGSDPRGEGDPGLELFDDNGVAGPTGGITPNAHALSRRFSLLDHVYANSEESTVGHKITAGGYANDYTERYVFTNRGRKGNPDIYPIGIPPNAFIFDQAVRQDVGFHIYGELGAGNQPFANDGRPTYPEVQANTDAAYATQIQGTCRGAIPFPDGTPLSVKCTADAGSVGMTSGRPAASSRVNAFQSQFQSQLASGSVPAFNYLILFNDHTDGTTPGVYTPAANLADNDLALGQVVELVSQSPIWKSSAIFVLEDDSQDGTDSVDAHRIPAFVISPWAKHGGQAISERFDQYSFLRTAEMILGLDPLSINDALATPLYKAFISGDAKPDVAGTRYHAIAPETNLTAVNGPEAPDAELSAALPYDRVDLVPQRISDKILWHSIFGARSQVPPAGPDSSEIERARAVGAMRRYRHGGNPSAFLAAGGEAENERVRQITAGLLASGLGISPAEALTQLEGADGDSETEDAAEAGGEKPGESGEIEPGDPDD